MAPHDTSETRDPSETSPLLRPRGEAPETSNGTVENQNEDAEANGVPIAKPPSEIKLWIILGSIWFGVFFGALDSTIVATLATPISDSFNSFKLLSWLATSYLIANAALQPLFGRITDIFSRRAGLVFSNIFFALGNLICGLAQSEGVMITGRVVAGIGGGGLMTIATFVASDLIPLRRRGLFQGFGNVAYGLGAGFGGIYGGWINDVRGWRLAFLIQVPIIVFSGILIFVTVDIPVKEKSKSRIKRVDFLGAFTLVTSLVLLLLGLNSGGNIVPWKHPLVLVTLPLSLIFLLIFVYVEDRVASEPIIPVRLLLHRTVACACLTNWFGTMAVFSLLYYGPIYFQVLGLSASAAGARLIPNSIGASVGSLGTGILMRATGRYYVLNLIISLILVASFALAAGTMYRYIAAWPPFIYFAIGGIGYGGMLTISLLALIAAVDHEHQAVITSASYAFRSTGSTIGITVASAAFQNILKDQLWSRFADYQNAAEIITKVRDSVESIKHLPPGWYDGVIDSYMTAFRGVWILNLGIAVLGALASLGMAEHVLHKSLDRKSDP